MLQALVKQRALEAGFDLVGIAPATAWEDLKFARQWVERGYGGEMCYLENSKRDDPRRALASVQSVICLGLVYNTPFPYSTEGRTNPKSKIENLKSNDGQPTTDNGRSSAWISRYAWGADYHRIMRERLERLRAAIAGLATNIETRVYVDTGPIVERAFARLSGIGWMGKNTCLINQGIGSWFFLGVVLTNLELPPDLPAPDRCGSCTRCIEACPTGALVEPYMMDGSRCISYFTIELKDSIPSEFRSAIGANVFGCDICQDVCPWNNRPVSAVSSPLQQSDPAPAFSAQHRAATTELEEFQPLEVDLAGDSDGSQSTVREAATGNPPRTTDKFSLFSPSLHSLAEMSEDDFRRSFRHSPIKRLKYRGWLRNLCVAMGNSGDRSHLPRLHHLREHADALVREHTEWAIDQLTPGESSEQAPVR